MLKPALVPKPVLVPKPIDLRRKMLKLTFKNAYIPVNLDENSAVEKDVVEERELLIRNCFLNLV
jgi:hypothetical protein